MLLNAVIVLGMKEYIYWYLEKERAKKKKKMLLGRLKSELLNFKVHFIYFVYLPPIFFPSRCHILSRMCNRIFTTIMKDSFKNCKFKKAGLVKETQKRHYKYILCYFYVFCSLKSLCSKYQLAYSSEKNYLRFISCY